MFSNIKPNTYKLNDDIVSYKFKVLQLKNFVNSSSNELHST